MADVITRFKAETTQWDASLRRGKKGLDDLGKSADSASKYFHDFSSGLKTGALNLTGIATGAGAAMKALDLLQSAVANNIETARGFEKSMSSLQSLTGLTGEKLDYLKQKAIDLGGSTTQSASQVAEAFMLIGSKMPDLLSDADALSKVTEAAIRLAEASGDDVTTSANALTAALNIMGEGADQATRYINVLAAGSQKGTRNIQELTDIVFRAGQNAHATGISFEELIAIAAAGTKEFDSAESAGQGLSKLFIQLEKQSKDELKPSVVGLATALENLAKENYSVVEATKLFTQNGAKAYTSIVNNKDAILETLPAITNTNTALEQAAINIDNLDGALKSLDSAWEKFNLTINDNNSLLTEVIKDATSMVNIASDLIDKFKSLPEPVKNFVSQLKEISLESLPGVGAVYRAMKTMHEMLQAYRGAETSAGSGTGGGKKTVYRDRNTGKVYDSMDALNNANKKKSTKQKEYDDTTLKGIREHINALKEERLLVDKDSQAWANLTAEITRLQGLVSTKKVGLTKEQKLEKKLRFNPEFYTEDELEKQLLEINKTRDWNGIVLGISVKDEGGLAELEKMMQLGDGKKSIDLPVKNYGKKPDKSTEASLTKEGSQILSGISGICGSLEQMGVEIPEGIKSAVSTLQGIMGIVSSIATVVSAIQTIQTASLFKFFAQGGIAHAANGFIGGNNPSGDLLPIMVNSGELILNKAQQGNLASQLGGGIGGGLNLTTSISMRELRIALNSESQQRGKGKYVTTHG